MHHHSLRSCLPLLASLLFAAACIPGISTGADTSVTSKPAALAQPASVGQQRLPRVRMHGAALNGGERNLGVDEIDRVALLNTWKIHDPYKKGDAQYTGIRLKDLVDALAPAATHVRMRAINDYVTVFERSEWETLPVLLATRDGDKRMSVANKGPARIVFLQTRENEMAMQVHAPKWIWQVVDVEFQSR